MYEGSITDIKGIKVGHAQDSAAETGVSVVLARGGAICGCDVRGGAPGTRETALMAQARTVKKLDAVLLAGGSAFGLDAAGGVMRWCEERGMGVDTGVARVPIVAGAVIYDLACGDPHVRPDAEMGFEACEAARSQTAQGVVGAGTGATVGKLLGMDGAQRGGIGTACITLAGGAKVGALICVNALGDVVENGAVLAGARGSDGMHVNAAEYILKNGMEKKLPDGANTTIGVVATDASLDRDDVTKLAQVGHDGLALSISPIHTAMDGDTIFALSYGEKRVDINELAVAAAEAVRRAVINAILAGRNA